IKRLLGICPRVQRERGSPETAFRLDHAGLYLLPFFRAFLRFAVDSTTLTVLAVVSHRAAMSFGLRPARWRTSARSFNERVSGATLSASRRIIVSSLVSMRAR